MSGHQFHATTPALEARAGVVAEVLEELRRQDEKWGEQNHSDGTGPRLVWTFVGPAEFVAMAAKRSCQERARTGHVTWQDILLEEVAEAFAEDRRKPLREELVQIAAVALQWVAAIDRRAEQVA